jgi:hypothetical protein
LLFPESPLEDDLPLTEGLFGAISGLSSSCLARGYGAEGIEFAGVFSLKVG